MRQHRNTPQSVVLRVDIVLGAAAGRPNHGLARELSISLPTVLLWRRRYEAEGIVGLLKDHPGSGLAKTITADREAAIVEPTLRAQPPMPPIQVSVPWRQHNTSLGGRASHLASSSSPSAPA